MSTSKAIIDALVSQLATGLTAYTVQDHFTQLTAIDSEQLPFAMVFDPSATRDRDDDAEVVQTVSVGVVLLRDEGESEAVTMRTDVDSAISSIEDTPRLGDIVDFAFVSEWQVNETAARFTIGSLVVDTEVEL